MLLFSCEIFYCCSFCYSQFLYTYACAEKFSASAQTLPLGLQAAPLAPGALFSKQGTKAFSSAEYAAKSSSFSEIQSMYIPNPGAKASDIQSFHMCKSLVSEFIFFLVYLHSPNSDHDSPQYCIPRSRVLVKSPCTALDLKSCIPEFLVKLNPKFSDPDVFTRN